MANFGLDSKEYKNMVKVKTDILEFASQRTDGFKAGIQKGTVATDAEALKLDNMIKVVALEIREELKKFGFTMEQRINKDLLKSAGVQHGCAPDGGIWSLNGVRIAAFEAKKQGKRGNAIERHGKNVDTCKYFEPNIRYVTFGIGEGSSPSGPVWNYALSSMAKESSIKTPLANKKVENVLYETGLSWFLKPEGFLAIELKMRMLEAILGVNMTISPK